MTATATSSTLDGPAALLLAGASDQGEIDPSSSALNPWVDDFEGRSLLDDGYDHKKKDKYVGAHGCISCQPLAWSLAYWGALRAAVQLLAARPAVAIRLGPSLATVTSEMQLLLWLCHCVAPLGMHDSKQSFSLYYS